MNKYKLALLFLFILIGTLVSCESDGINSDEKNIIIDSSASLNANIGKDCTVQFKRDILGQSADLPTPADTDSINGAEVQIKGKYAGAFDDWVIIEQDGNEVWIYKPNILYIKFQ